MTTRRFWVKLKEPRVDVNGYLGFHFSYLIEENGQILLQRTLERDFLVGPLQLAHGAYKVKYKRENDQNPFIRLRSLSEYLNESLIYLLKVKSETEEYQTLIADLEQFAIPDKLKIAGYHVNPVIGLLTSLLPEYGRYFDYAPFDVFQFVEGFRVAGMLPVSCFSLNDVCAYFDITIDGENRTMTEVLKTKAVFDRLAGMIEPDWHEKFLATLRAEKAGKSSGLTGQV